VLGLVAIASLSTSSQAETGKVSLVITKAGLVVGIGGGRGTLTFRGHNYKFSISGLSLGATIGASTTKLVGRALHMHAPGDLAGTYNTIGAGAAVGLGAGGVRLRNKNGVLLELAGGKVGLEFSVSAGGMRISMK